MYLLKTYSTQYLLNLLTYSTQSYEQLCDYRLKRKTDKMVSMDLPMLHACFYILKGLSFCNIDNQDISNPASNGSRP